MREKVSGGLGQPVDQEPVTPKSMEGISNEPECEDKPTSSKKSKLDDEKTDKVQETMGNPIAESIQDQIIIAPEIMSMILKQLDLRSLKKVRLVCRSWLREVQIHIRRRTVVRFQRDGFQARIISFNQACRNHLPALPNPFECIDLDLHSMEKSFRFNAVTREIESLCPTLLITRFDSVYVPWKFILLVIIRWSSSLEYLKIHSESSEGGYLPPRDPEQKFPKLTHVATEISAYGFLFPSIVSWIVNASPSLETFESKLFGNKLEMASEILLNIDLKSVKRLILRQYGFDSAALEHFLSIPFYRIQDLKILLVCSEGTFGNHEAVIATIKKCALTLKTLEFSKLDEQLPDFEFPTCPIVQELTLPPLRYSRFLIHNPFPSVQVLNWTLFDVDVLGDLWRDLPPFSGVKTLRTVVNCIRVNRTDELFIRFFDKFPSLERIRLDSEFLLRTCILKATGIPRFAKILDSVRHLEIRGKVSCQHDAYSYLGALKGIESLTMIESNAISEFIPFPQLTSLKVVYFPWGDCLNMSKLLEISRGVKKIFVINCCSVPRIKDQLSAGRLKLFFDIAPNAECGCGKSG